MKRFKFLAPVAVAAAMIFASCNSGEEKKVADAPDTTAAKTPEVTTEPAKLSDMLVVTHKVANFAKWMPAYEAHDSTRLASGIHSYVIGRGVKDTNMVFLAMKIDDTAKAKAFAMSADLKATMQKAGVMGMPNISFTHMVMMDTSSNAITTRLRVTHKVKDWDAWKKVFDADKPNRMNAGLIDRALGYSIDDNHMVTIVFVVTDMKKAEEFGKSPELKKKMEEGGVVGPPSMFFYTVVKKY